MSILHLTSEQSSISANTSTCSSPLDEVLTAQSIFNVTLGGNGPSALKLALKNKAFGRIEIGFHKILVAFFTHVELNLQR
jgi:hypothetical protein